MAKVNQRLHCLIFQCYFSFQKYKPDVCRSLQTNWGSEIEISTAAILDQYDTQESRFLQKYEKVLDMLRHRVDVLSPMKRSAISELNRAKDNWKTFLYVSTFSMDNCRKLLKENDPAKVIKPVEQQIKKMVNAEGKLYPLELIDWNKFNEFEMTSYIERYEEEADPQFYRLFNGKENPLKIILTDVRKAVRVRPPNQGFETENYEYLRVLVECVNAITF